jgi:hypothetical protein
MTDTEVANANAQRTAVKMGICWYSALPVAGNVGRDGYPVRDVLWGGNHQVK